ALTLHPVANGLDDVEHGIVFAEAFPPPTFLNVIQHRAPALIERLNLRNVRRAIYEGQHKLAVLDQRIEGLFDVQTDPTEVHNVAADHGAKVAEMQRKLASLVTLAESRRAEAGFTAAVDEAVIDHLRALGYIE